MNKIFAVIVCDVPIDEIDNREKYFFKINFHSNNNRKQMISKNNDMTTTKNNSVFIPSPHLSNLNFTIPL